uniref:Uncharacterized protein n=1 Tax=Rhodotorula toruloides TaxID=5286 RepID=A0A0K3C782_RHOTO
MANFSAVEQRVAAMSYDQVLDALHEGPRALVLALPESFRDQLARTVLETGWRAKEVGRAEGRLEWRKDSIDAKLKLFGCSARSPGNEVLECIDTLTSLKYEGSSPELECKALVEAGSFEALAYQTAGFSSSSICISRIIETLGAKEGSRDEFDLPFIEMCRDLSSADFLQVSDALRKLCQNAKDIL